MRVRIERIVDELPADFEAMRAEARAEGHGMLDTLAAEWAARTTRFDRAGEALLAAYVGGGLAGIGGLTVEPVVPGAFRMRRFYVRAAFRRSGIGRTLALTLFEHAPCAATLVTANAAVGSERFWRALGFAPDARDGHTHLIIRQG
jgi:GNAT superfamily N-acetyltransferase